MKHKELAQDYFERHSISNECHISSDGRVFHTSGHAISFVQEHNLQDQTIESYTRDQVAPLEEIFTVDQEDQDSINKRNEIRLKLVEEYTKLFQEKPSDDLEIEELEVLINQETAKLSKEADDKLIIEAFKTFDIATGDYQEAKAYVKSFNIEVADQKADTLKAALTEYKNNLAQ